MYLHTSLRETFGLGNSPGWCFGPRYLGVSVGGWYCRWVCGRFCQRLFFFVFTLSPKRLGTYMHLVGMIASLTAASRPVTYLMFVVRRLGTSWRGEGGRELSRGHVL